MDKLTPETYMGMEKAMYESVGGRYEISSDEELKLNQNAFDGLLIGDIEPLLELLSTPAEPSVLVKCMLVKMFRDESPTMQRFELKKARALKGNAEPKAEKSKKALELFEIGDVAIAFGANEKGGFEAAIVDTMADFKRRGKDLSRSKVIRAIKYTRENRIYVDLC